MRTSMPSPTAIVIEDEPQIRRFVRGALEAEGWQVHEAGTLRDGLAAVGTRQPDLVVLDLGLPDGDGVGLIRDVRGWSGVPIIVLSARTDEADKIAALDAGADDYLTKPFDFRELLVRLRALIRRGAHPPAADQFVVGDLAFDVRARRVLVGVQVLALTAREYALLEHLARRADAVVGRADIAEHVWDERYEPFSNVIDVYVQRLRRKLEAAGAHTEIRTRRGEGYQLVPADAPGREP
jgi:two-component system, OmpR family, KDP operon response regulator KdpE